MAALGAALLLGFGLDGPAAAQADAVPAFAMTTGRLGGSAAALVALTGMVIGGMALARARRAAAGSRAASVALLLGLIGMAFGGLVVGTAGGGLGTGHGLGGGIVAVVLGLLGMVLGGLARARSGRTG